MKILVACEMSGIVRDAFTAKGHDVVSCDLLPSLKPGKHYRGNVFDIINDGWDMMLGFPPCFRLCRAGARWWSLYPEEREEAIIFFLALAKANIPKIAIENPIGSMSRLYRKPDQIIQPWQFGHGETKATCLWLKGLPLLTPTDIVDGREHRIHRMPPSKDRSMLRSLTYPGIAEAMAGQWS